MAFFGQLFRIHLGRRRNPQLHRDIAFAFEQFRCGTEVTDIGHARTDKYFVDFRASYIRQSFHVVRIVRAGNDWLMNIRQVDVDDRGVFRIVVPFEQLRIFEPFFHRFDTACQSACILVAFSNHPFHHGDVGIHVLDDRFFVQMNGTTSRRALCRCVGQFKRLFHFQIRQAFDFQNTA